MRTPTCVTRQPSLQRVGVMGEGPRHRWSETDSSSNSRTTTHQNRSGHRGCYCQWGWQWRGCHYVRLRDWHRRTRGNRIGRSDVWGRRRTRRCSHARCGLRYRSCSMRGRGLDDGRLSNKQPGPCQHMGLERVHFSPWQRWQQAWQSFESR